MKNQLIIFILFLIPVLGFSQVPGSDRDKHGCIGSAGYTYSVIKKDCIQIFNQEVKLQGVGEGSYSTQTCVIFNESKKKAEIFLPDMAGSVILKRKQKDGKIWWEKSGIQLSEIENGLELKKDGVLIYKS